MSVLELIRKNSIIVLVAVFGVGVGLIMMDYADKGSMIGGNSYVKVNGTGYSYQEIFNLGENGKEYIQQLVQASNGKLVDRFDADDNDSLSDDERAALQAYAQQHPEYDNFAAVAQDTLRMWCYGGSENAETNIAINRAVLQHEPPPRSRLMPTFRPFPLSARQTAISTPICTTAWSAPIRA